MCTGFFFCSFTGKILFCKVIQVSSSLPQAFTFGYIIYLQYGQVVTFIHLFVFIFGCIGSSVAQAFSSCGECGLLFAAVRGLLTVVTSLVAEHGLQAHQLQQLRRTGSVVVARRLQSTGSVVVAHGLSCSTAWGSSRTRARTHVPCIGRQILNHCTTREVPAFCAC